MQSHVKLGHGIPDVHRLGLATRGNTRLRESDLDYALERGLNYWNWCGRDDAMSRAVAKLGARRAGVAVAVQFDAGGDLDEMRRRLDTEYIDVATLYYVESEAEWGQIVRPGGGWDHLDQRRRARRLRAIGLTTHQRKLAARWAESGKLDLLMVRYNAAHRGAERDVFPVAASHGVPVVSFTALRWQALLAAAPGDPPGFAPPSAADCYRFCLSNPQVAVTLAAPNNRDGLDHALTLLDDWRASTPEELDAIRAHGDRVHKSAGTFW
ncbi:MAG: aldo/keto reductase [Bryobacteraceae bacterium]